MPEQSARTPIVLAVHGTVDAAAEAHAVAAIRGITDDILEPVFFVNVELACDRSRPAMAEAMLDINGDLVRAHVSADDINDAIDRVVENLRLFLRSRDTITARRPVEIDTAAGDAAADDTAVAVTGNTPNHIPHHCDQVCDHRTTVPANLAARPESDVEVTAGR
jgi:ribosome-associated translation inhibitor RaiA